MKRIFCLMLALMLLLSACGAPTQPETEEETPVQTEPEPVVQQEQKLEPPTAQSKYFNPLTGLPTEKDISNQKPVAIMLNNISVAMPQQGNSKADIIYEVLAEGGITRMIGIYQDISDLGVVGSVRSARLYFLELALGHDAVYVHAGGSPEFYSYADQWGISTVDGVNGPYAYANAGLFWRDAHRVAGKNYAYEHSLITSGEKLTKVLGEHGVLGNHKEGYTYEMHFAADETPVGGQNAEKVTVPFSASKSTAFRYDKQSGVYLVEEHGGAYIDGNNGTQVSVANVLVLKTKCTVVDSAGRNTVDLSRGNGWYICGGKYIPITWEKGERGQYLRYFTADGQPLTLRQGKSYVCIIPLEREVKAE